MMLYTIGFTKKSASDFFGVLRHSGVKRVVDVRLNNVSQLAGFTKARDLPYFLESIGGIGYVHIPDLAPTPEILNAYKKQGGSWAEYESRFVQLMKERQIERSVASDLVDGDCLLCSEEKPTHCHRRLVAEYLASYDPRISIRHLG